MTVVERGEAVRIVGVGASAGGLEALETFFENMPAHDGIAFVVVQHLSPDYKSLMGEILSKHTEMEIHQAEDGTAVQAGSIYLIPRRKNLTCYQRRIFLTDQERGLNLPIDIFFRSLAEDQGERAVGIVLSGTGSDGTRGIRAIKEAGGMVMVQSEESAKFDGMPKSAISTGIVDYILPPQKMPDELVNYTRGNVRIAGTGEQPAESERSSLSKIFLLIRRRAGVDLSHYKESTIIRRVERRMGIKQIDNLGDYVELLQTSPEEVTTLFKEILIGVTKFFRDPEAFEYLKDQVLPEVLSRKEEGEQIRLWVAGCSTGEEAYSLAILLEEFAEERGIKNEIKVFATDIDKSALEHASSGIYPESIAADAASDRLAKYFVRNGDAYQINRTIREMVVFAYHNVFKDPPFRKIDLISCRNLLIYLQTPLQQQVLNNFQFSLTEGGFLFLGTSETAGEQARYFESVDAKWKILRFKGGKPGGESGFSAPDLSWKANRELRSVEERNFRQGSNSDDVRGVFEPAYEKLMEAYMPPGAIIDENRQVLHLFGETQAYLTLPSGRTDLHILKMARKELSIPLGSALELALRERRQVILEPVSLSEGEQEPAVVQLSVTPVRDRRGALYFGVLFDAPDRGTGPSEAPRLQIEESVRRRVEDLESELQSTKENLQATIEELETSNEELQATNEELLSSNEELQSTNEELQSVNEELITVNAEYQKKIEELSELNDDMDNLFGATNIGTIFLDDKLRIRKFTPPAAQQISVIESDIGRKITDLSNRLDYEQLEEAIRRVMETGTTAESETRNEAGEWFLVKIMPYTSNGSEFEGSVVSLIDITRRKRAELALTRQRDLLMRVVEANPTGITMVNAKGELTFTNRRGTEILGLQEEEGSERTYNDPRFRITDLEGKPIPDEDLPFWRILETGEGITDYRHKIERHDGTVTIKIEGSPIYGENGEIEGAVFNLTEIAEEKMEQHAESAE